MASRNGKAARRWLAPAIAAVAAISLGYFVYQQLTKNEESDQNANGTTKQSSAGSLPRTTKISIVVSKSLLEQGIPLEPLLKRYPELIVVASPNVTKASDRQLLDSQVPSDEKHRIIPCETQIGIVHVLKHLRSDRVYLPADVPENVPVDINRFVGSIIKLSSDPSNANEQMKELVG